MLPMCSGVTMFQCPLGYRQSDCKVSWFFSVSLGEYWDSAYLKIAYDQSVYYCKSNETDNELILNKIRFSTLSLETRLQTGRQGFSYRQWQWCYFFLFATASRLALSPPNLLSNGFRWLLPQGQCGRGMKLITHLYLVPRLIMCGAIPPLSQYVFVAWCLIKQDIRFHGMVLS
jgi:hypothetical protein